jgi:methionyl-tRNA formyltransferase
MIARDLRIIFMGTPEFSVQILKGLIEGGYKVVGVVTTPDKSAGRGLKVQESDVKKYAVQQNLKVLQPEKLKNKQFIDELKSLNADLQIVVAFRMLPEQVWGMPKMGTFNLHASLLPEYRGAAPINWAIINGEEKTGLTTFLIDNEIDTGKILLKKEIEIKKTDSAGDLHDRMMILGANLVKETIEIIASGSIKPVKQTELINNPDQIKAAPKIFKEDCRVNWHQKSEKIYNFIRGMSPYPCAWTTLKNTETGNMLNLKVFKSDYQVLDHQLNPGSIKHQKDVLFVSAVDGFISLKEIQLEGKKKLKIDEFLRGFSIENYILI